MSTLVSENMHSQFYEFGHKKNGNLKIMHNTTNEPTNVPRCGALSLLQTLLHFRGGVSSNRCYAKSKFLWSGDCVLGA
jgi:hypothetical protein